MSKFVPSVPNGGYNLSAINNNFQEIADLLNNQVLFRDNPIGEPNQLENDLDINGHDLLNVDTLKIKNLILDGTQINDQLDAVLAAANGAAAAAAESATDAEAAEVAAETALAEVKTIFLGAFSSDPVGTQEGSLYFNTTTDELRYFRNGVWTSFPQASTVNRQFFVAGTDFTAGTTTVLTLPATLFTKTILWIYFDGAYVQPNRYTLTDQTHITFTAPITAGTTRIEVGYIAPLASVVVDDLSITTSKLAEQAATTSKIADSAVTAAKLGIVDDINQKLGVALAVDSIATMKALPTGTLSKYTWINVAGYYAGTDEGGGRYLVTNDTTTVADEGKFVVHTATGRRFYLDYQAPPTIQQYGGKLDGVTDDSNAVQRMTQIGGLTLVVPEGRNLVINTPTTLQTRVKIEPGGRITNGNLVNLIYKPEADPKERIFFGGGSYNLLGGSVEWDECPADWFGTEPGAAITTAWKFSKVVTLNQRGYNWLSSATVPAQRQGNVLRGKGFRTTQGIIGNGVVAINYQRVAGQAGSSLQVDNIEFQESGLLKTATAIKWRGAAAGAYGAETIFYDDNWLRVNNCVFLGLQRGTDTIYATQCFFTDNYYQANAICHFMDRDSSFFYMTREMALDNTFSGGSYIFHQDPTNDARSNGLTVTDCHSVLSTGVDVQLQNYQLAQFHGTTLDLGTAGVAALALNNCQDIHFTDGWIASSAAGRAGGRAGVFYLNTRHSSFNGNTFNGCATGFFGTNGSSVSINDTAFDNCRDFDITDNGSAIGYYVSGNKHKNNVTGAPISLGGGASKSNIVVNNMMTGSSYSIPVGTNSINTPNVFSAGFPV